MVSSQIAAWCIMWSRRRSCIAMALRISRMRPQAAKALEPLVHSFPHSGFLAELIFAIGIIGLGFLAVPVFSGSASLRLSEALSWRAGLNLKLRRAHGFLRGDHDCDADWVDDQFCRINPMQALGGDGSYHGVIAVPLIFLIADCSDTEINGEYRSGMLSELLVGLRLCLWGSAWLFVTMKFLSGEL